MTSSRPGAARDAPRVPRCGCCGSADTLVTRCSSHRTADRFSACSSCDLAPAVPQAPWDGFLERAAGES